MAFAGRRLRELAGDLQAGRITAEEMVGSCLAAVDARENEVQAWAWLDREAARTAARKADQTAERGRLQGLPFGIKDVIDTSDMPTEYGSPIYAGHRPANDAAVVAALRDAGGIVLGKTVTCEFAGGLPSRTRNPRNPDHTPGGSSSGSAAAVAAGMVPLALGTQTAGSIIRPASFCGVAAFKPTFGMLNRGGVKQLAESLDTLGLFGQTIEDVGWAMSILAQRPELADDTALGRPPRLLLCRTDKWDLAEPDGRAVLDRATSILSNAGAMVDEGCLPFSCAELMTHGMAVLATDARAAFGPELRRAPDQISGKMRAFLEKGETGTRTGYDFAQAALDSARTAFDTVFSKYDAVLTLSAPGEALEGLESTGNASFNFPWTLLHGPALSVPGQTGRRGLPIGVQLLGPRRGDARLLQVGRWAETFLAGT